MKKSGQITVFLSLLLISVCAFLCCILESARTAGARCYLQLAADSAIESLMSEYHKGLWDNYKILLHNGGYGRDGLQLGNSSKKLEQYMEYYLKPSKDLLLAKGNFYPIKLDFTGIESVEKVIDNKGQPLETEILSYMKYGAVDLVLDTLFEQYEQQKGAEYVVEIANSYSAHTKEALKLEDKIGKIQQALLNQQKKYNELLELFRKIGDTLMTLKDRLEEEGEEHDGSGPWDEEEEDNWEYIYYLRNKINRDVKSYLSKSALLKKDLHETKGYIEEYQKEVQKFKDNLKQTNSKIFEKEEDVSKEIFGVLMQETKQYDAYISQTGERYQAVKKAEEKITHNLGVLDNADRIQLLLEEEIYVYNVGGKLNSWSQWLRELLKYESTNADQQGELGDKEKLKLIENIQKMAEDGILGLVMGDKEISKGRISSIRLPSQGVLEEEKTVNLGVKELGINFITNEYFQIFLTTVLSEEKKEFQYEVEYLLGGKGSDRENLMAAIGQILILREGMNLMYLLTDGARRSEAEALATIIVGGTGLYPLVLMVTFLILTVWALGEALVDIKALLDNKRVPMIKNRENWQLGLEGLLTLGKDSNVKQGTDIEGGITYKGYLRILLVKLNKTKKYFRAMDIMQINIQRQEINFYMDQCLYKIEMLGSAKGKHVFFSVGFVNALMGTPDISYQMKVKAIKAY